MCPLIQSVYQQLKPLRDTETVACRVHITEIQTVHGKECKINVSSIQTTQQSAAASVSALAGGTAEPSMCQTSCSKEIQTASLNPVKQSKHCRSDLYLYDIPHPRLLPDEDRALLGFLLLFPHEELLWSIHCTLVVDVGYCTNDFHSSHTDCLCTQHSTFLDTVTEIFFLS